MSKIIRFLKALAGILLFPVVYGAGKAFYFQISGIGDAGSSFLFMERGILVYVLIHVLVMRPVYLYVVGHEFVHVLATWMCGGRVESFNVSPAGGSVVTSKTNIFIELSPYFVPIYTLLLGPVFMIAKAATDGFAGLTTIFLFLVGFTLAFHFVMTTEVLKMEQSDIAKSGMVFSLVLIFLFNIVIIMGVFCPFFKGISFINFVKNAWDLSREAYIYLYENALQLAALAIDKVKEVTA